MSCEMYKNQSSTFTLPYPHDLGPHLSPGQPPERRFRRLHIYGAGQVSERPSARIMGRARPQTYQFSIHSAAARVVAVRRVESTNGRIGAVGRLWHTRLWRAKAVRIASIDVHARKSYRGSRQNSCACAPARSVHQRFTLRDCEQHSHAVSVGELNIYTQTHRPASLSGAARLLLARALIAARAKGEFLRGGQENKNGRNSILIGAHCRNIDFLRSLLSI